jgi:hypothetical protein
MRVVVMIRDFTETMLAWVTRSSTKRDKIDHLGMSIDLACVLELDLVGHNVNQNPTVEMKDNFKGLIK